MNSQECKYPTRLREPADPSPRLEPVIHSRNHHRWDGPLDEVSLSRYERDGYLWFEGFFSHDRIQPFFEELVEISNDDELMRSDLVIQDPKSGRIRSVFDMHRISERFDKLTRDLRIL